MSSPKIEAFLFDELNEAEINAHHVSVLQVYQVLENRYVVIPNRKRRRGIYLVIGRDNGGTYITIPVEPTHESSLWRPITAWHCKNSERTILRKTEGCKWKKNLTVI